MSLIARHFESIGIPTLVLGSALDILKYGNPPRTVFVNYPLGFESGRFKDKADQLDVVRQALQQFDRLQESGLVLLENEWLDGWHTIDEREKGILDHRSPRSEEPQYQTEADRLAAQKNPT